MQRLEIAIDVDSIQGMDVFLHALNDAKLRKGLSAKKSGLPRGVSDILAMTEDPEFLERTKKLHRQYISLRAGKLPLDAVTTAGTELREYINKRYPAGHKALQSYAQSMAPQKLWGSVEVNADVVANVEAVANAAVYVNAAVATNVLVAAVAVVFAGVFVAGGTNI